MKQFLLFFAIINSSEMIAQNNFDIQGHRGCRGLYPENTIIAFLEAVKLGVNTLEMDVVVTKDRLLVVSHDPIMNPFICKPFANSSSEKSKASIIYEMTYEEVKTFDCGILPNQKFPEQKKVSAVKPLLSEVIDSIESYIHEHSLPKVYYNIETKSTPAGDDLEHPSPTVFSKLLYDLLKQKNVLQKSTVQSFDRRTLQEIHKIDNTLSTALLVLNLESFKRNISKLGFKPSIYSPNLILVNKKLVEQCHQAKIKIIPWTINKEEEMLKLQNLGVDGLITDYPNKAIEVIRK